MESFVFWGHNFTKVHIIYLLLHKITLSSQILLIYAFFGNLNIVALNSLSKFCGNIKCPGARGMSLLETSSSTCSL